MSAPAPGPGLAPAACVPRDLAEHHEMLVRRARRNVPARHRPARSPTAEPGLRHFRCQPNRGSCAVYADGAAAVAHVERCCARRGILFLDPEFPLPRLGEPPHHDQGGEGCREGMGAGEWRRVPAAGATWVAEDELSADLCQGPLGDCWLVAALDALQRSDPGAVAQLFAAPRASACGVAGVRLFFPPLAAWRTVLLDTRLPALPGSDGLCGVSPAPWAALVEKAFAKLLGGYARLAGRSGWALPPRLAIEMLTGVPVRVVRPPAGQGEAALVAAAADLAARLAARPPPAAVASLRCTQPEEGEEAGAGGRAGGPAPAPPAAGHHAVSVWAAPTSESLCMCNSVPAAAAASMRAQVPAFPPARVSRVTAASLLAAAAAVAVASPPCPPLPHVRVVFGRWARGRAGGYLSADNPQHAVLLAPGPRGGVTARIELHPAADALRRTEHAAFLRVAALPPGAGRVRSVRRRDLPTLAASDYRSGAAAEAELVVAPGQGPAAARPLRLVVVASFGATGAGAEAPYSLVVRASGPVLAVDTLDR